MNIKGLSGSFFLLWQGLIVSAIGMGLFSTVSILWLTTEVGSGSMAGLFMLMNISGTVVVLAGGVMADRLSRKSIIVIADFACGIVLFGMGLVFYLYEDITIRVIALFAGQFILSIIGSAAMPSFMALLGDILPEKRLPIGNMLLTFGASAGDIVSRSLGGQLFVLLGAPLLIFFTSVTYLFSSLSEKFIRVPETDFSKQQGEKKVTDFRMLVSELRAGFLYVLNNEGIKDILITRFICQACSTSLFVALPFLIENQYNKGIEWFGYFLSILTVGLMLGSLYGGVTFNQVEGMGRRTNQYVFCMIVSPLLYVGLFFLENVYCVSVLMFCIGFFSMGLPNALVMPQIQIVVPNDLRGRVMSVNLMVISCCVFGAALSGFLIDVFDKNAALVMGLWGVLACVVVYPLLLKKACLGFLEVVKKSVGDGNGNQLAHIHK